MVSKKKHEHDRFLDAVGESSDSVLFVLRGHLLAENYLERIIAHSLTRGDKVVQSGSFGFYQKLILVDALGQFDDRYIQCFKNLNSVRNKLAHELGKNISRTDTELIGQPLGPRFREIQREAKYDDALTLHRVIAYLCGYLAGAIVSLEQQERDQKREANGKEHSS